MVNLVTSVSVLKHKHESCICTFAGLSLQQQICEGKDVIFVAFSCEDGENAGWNGHPVRI